LTASWQSSRPRTSREPSASDDSLEACWSEGKPGHAQVRADLWAEGLADEGVRDRLSVVIRERRARLRRWIEQGIRVGELPPVPANALAAIVLALGDGLLLHAGLDPAAFSWSNIRRAFETLVEGASKVR